MKHKLLDRGKQLDEYWEEMFRILETTGEDQNASPQGNCVSFRRLEEDGIDDIVCGDNDKDMCCDDVGTEIPTILL
jgi:hypothetical protein